MKRKYRISVHGCDDSTIIELKLTEQEFKIIQMVVVEVSKASKYICMPTMDIEELRNDNKKRSG